MEEKTIKRGGTDFLQSEEWRKFQEATGKRTYCITGEDISAGVIEHKLPLVGRYFYMPRGPIFSEQESVNSEQCFKELIKLAEENKVGWIRVDIKDEKILELIKKSLSAIGGFRGGKIRKAPHDMQPREIFVIDITKPEEELLSEMKSKTRYNINLAQKKGVKVFLWNMEHGTKRVA
ncbi:MAG: peptidoglycan bridge formation glycyltransferase FemA/FemB family protein [Patescibacteria group bacterium]